MDRITNSTDGKPHSHPTCTTDMSLKTWQIRMGIRCAECEKYLPECKCRILDSSGVADTNQG